MILKYIFCRLNSNFFFRNFSSLQGYSFLLYNHFTKENRQVLINDQPLMFGELSKSLIGKVYVCGPTVYDYCHVGHALAYLRFDILKKFIHQFSNAILVTIMGITDIDDKIIDRSAKMNISAKTLADNYFIAFLDDMSSLNIESLDAYVRISDHIDDIKEYISILENSGFAYLNTVTGDINFDTSKMPGYHHDTIEKQTESSAGKKSSRDFALWKNLPNSIPVWTYKSIRGQDIHGRPGWHIECSVIGCGLLGSSIDLHCGGKDLIFPHHYNESACSHSYFKMAPEKKWVNNWFHSGHLNIKGEKMSKSLGNTIFIKDFLKKYNANILRLICLIHHYRTDLNYQENIILDALSTENKIKHYLQKLHEKIYHFTINRFNKHLYLDINPLLYEKINESKKHIFSGIAEDLDLNKGLHSFLDVLHLVDKEELNLIELCYLRNFANKYIDAVGLDFGIYQKKCTKHQIVIDELIDYRHEVRMEALKAIKKKADAKISLKNILTHCDNVRDQLKNYGINVSDLSISSVKK